MQPHKRLARDWEAAFESCCHAPPADISSSINTARHVDLKFARTCACGGRHVAGAVPPRRTQPQRLHHINVGQGFNLWEATVATHDSCCAVARQATRPLATTTATADAGRSAPAAAAGELPVT